MGNRGDGFDARISKTETCWLWTGRKRGGYGIFDLKGSANGAHRVAWERARGAIPDGMYVCHRCNVKACVRPDHLYLATNKQNQLDAIRDGLLRPPKLTADQVARIRDRYANGDVTQQALADDFGVRQGHISKIVNRTQWSDHSGME